MAKSWACSLLLVVVCLTQLTLVAEATRPGPMLRGGTIVLFSRPRLGGAFAQSRTFQSDALDAGIQDVLDRMLDGPSIFGSPLQLLERQRGSSFAESFGPQQRRPCPFAAARERDAMMKRMAAARFGPGTLESLLATAAEAEEDAAEQEWMLDLPIYTINPASQAAAQHPLAARRSSGGKAVEAVLPGARHSSQTVVQPRGNGPEDALAHSVPRPRATNGGNGHAAPTVAGFSLTPQQASALTANRDQVVEIMARHSVRVTVDAAAFGPPAAIGLPTVTVHGPSAAAVETAANELAIAAGRDPVFHRGEIAASMATDPEETGELPGDVGASASRASNGIPDARSLRAGGDGGAVHRFSGFGVIAKRVQQARGAEAPQHRWRFRDFVSRPGGAAAGGAPQGERFEGASWPAFEAAFGIYGPPIGFRPASRAAPASSLSWDLFQQGQLNGGVLVFLLLCIACVAVWARLLLLWCSFTPGSCSSGSGRLCRRWGRRRAKAASAACCDEVSEGLEAPLLNPLHQEAPIAGGLYAVEVATKHAVPPPASGFVTLQYVPLRGEQ